MPVKLRSSNDVLVRYDLLCIEGIARAFRMFLGKDQPPNYKLAFPPDGDNGLLKVTISPEVCNLVTHFITT